MKLEYKNKIKEIKLLHFALFFICIFIIQNCLEQKKRICIVNDGEYHLYLKINALKKLGRLIPNMNIMVDYESSHEGRDYYRVNNNNWHGQIPKLDDSRISSSLWIPKESCTFHLDKPYGNEYTVFPLFYNKESLSNNPDSSNTKIYLLNNSDSLIISQISPSVISEYGEEWKNYEYRYGNVIESSDSQITAVMLIKDNINYIGGQDNFIIPLKSNKKNTFNFYCNIILDDRVECIFPSRKNTKLYGKKNIERFIGFGKKYDPEQDDKLVSRKN